MIKGPVNCGKLLADPLRIFAQILPFPLGIHAHAIVDIGRRNRLVMPIVGFLEIGDVIALAMVFPPGERNQVLRIVDIIKAVAVWLVFEGSRQNLFKRRLVFLCHTM